VLLAGPAPLRQDGGSHARPLPRLPLPTVPSPFCPDRRGRQVQAFIRTPGLALAHGQRRDYYRAVDGIAPVASIAEANPKAGNFRVDLDISRRRGFGPPGSRMAKAIVAAKGDVVPPSRLNDSTSYPPAPDWYAASWPPETADEHELVLGAWEEDPSPMDMGRRGRVGGVGTYGWARVTGEVRRAVRPCRRSASARPGP